MYAFWGTVCLSGLLNPVAVKSSNLTRNQQEINKLRSSETLRSLSSKKSELAWNQWLAGLIDGDGCFLVSKSGYTSCEITMGINDKRALNEIKQKLGGSVKLRAGLQAWRYRLHNKAGMIDLVTRVNGHIRNSVRFKQLDLICKTLNITLKEPSKLNKFNGWFAGFFDADGTVTYSIKNGYPQLTVSVCNKLAINVEDFKKNFSGNVYCDIGGYGSFKWSIQSKKDIEAFLEYIKIWPSRSHKKQRLHLIPKYYKLKDSGLYKPELNNKEWAKFVDNWNKRG